MCSLVINNESGVILMLPLVFAWHEKINVGFAVRRESGMDVFIEIVLFLTIVS
ncbi:hypothetical protein HmCmsJML132_01225 [Escherichia coli]|nr:hypothetical protein HmCmsJML132_01225 [Escherichia coli]